MGETSVSGIPVDFIYYYNMGAFEIAKCLE